MGWKVTFWNPGRGALVVVLLGPEAADSKLAAELEARALLSPSVLFELSTVEQV